MSEELFSLSFSLELGSGCFPCCLIFVSFSSVTQDVLSKIVPLDFAGREIVDLKNDENNAFQNLFSKLTDTKIYNFSEVAENTPILEKGEIKPFTLKDR